MLTGGPHSVVVRSTYTIVLAAETERSSEVYWGVLDPGSYAKPIHENETARALTYDPATGEITFAPARRRKLEVYLETRMADVETRNAALEARNADMEAQIRALTETVQALLP